MPIELTDIPAATASYLDTQVSMTVSAVTPKKPNQDVLTPGQDGTFTVTVTNAAAPDGVGLTNVTYHVKINDGSVAKLLVPESAAVASSDKLIGGTTLPRGSKQTEMLVTLLTGTTLGAGESQPPINIDVHCVDQGDAKITCHIHADIDQSDLFPTSQCPNGEQAVTVV
jgi:hypothetical protein